MVVSAAERELLTLAERLSAPVATTISGKGSIRENHPLAVGVVGSNGGTPETRSIVDRADLIVFAGCRAGSVTTERWRHPAPGTAKVIHLDVDPGVPGTNYPVDVPLVGDARLALKLLNAALADVQRPLEASLVQTAKEQKFAKFQALAESAAKPIKPERMVAALAGALDPDAIVVADAGTPCPYLSAYYEIRGTGRRFFSNRAHGALGYSMAAAMGAHLAKPQVKCVSVMGDGSFGFTWIQMGGAAQAVRNDLAPRPAFPTPPAAELQAYAGDYPLMPDFSLKVFERGGRLHIQGSGQQALATAAVAKDVFTIDEVGAEIRFERDASGRVIAVVLHQGGQALRGERK